MEVTRTVTEAPADTQADRANASGGAGAGPLIRLTSVSKRFGHDDGPPVIEDLSIAVQAEEFLGIIGPSGCGKSTVLNMLAGLLEPSAGRVAIERPDATVAYVFQRPRLLPWRTVLGNVRYGLEQADGLGRAEVQRRAAAALALVNLDGHEAKYPHQLSGGMQQRVAVARALAIDPDVLLLDEPFGALDALTRSYLQEELAGIVRRTRATVILVTHDIDEALLLTTRVLVMSSRPGRVRADRVVPFAAEVSNHDELVAHPDYPLLRTELRHLLRPDDTDPVIAP